MGEGRYYVVKADVGFQDSDMAFTEDKMMRFRYATSVHKYSIRDGHDNEEILGI